MTTKCSVKPINSTAEFKQQITELPAQCLAVIYFHASWAEPCQKMSTKLSQLAVKFDATNPPNIAFFALEAEELEEVSEEYKVAQVPSIVLQRNNNILEKVMGTNAAAVRDAVEKHLGRAGAGDTSRTGLPPAQQLTRPPAQPSGTPAASANGTSTDNSNGSSATGDVKERSKEDLNTHLKQLTSAAPVMLFMKGTPSAPQCGFSRQTVAILRENGIKYGFFNILADDEVRQGLKEFSDWPTFPQIYVGGELVGGLDILKEEFENDPDFLKDYSINKVAT